MKVSLFITCMCDIMNADVGKHTVEILERVGCEVDFPEAQTCCGQPAFNRDRKSTRLNSSHVAISYAVFCLKNKRPDQSPHPTRFDSAKCRRQPQSQKT